MFNRISNAYVIKKRLRPGERKGTELRVHTPTTGALPSQRRTHRPPARPCPPGWGRPRRCHRPCKLHSFLWTPPDDRIYVELVCRPSQLSSFLRRAVILLGEFGPPQQVWFVLRSGLAAWLDKKEEPLSLQNELCRIPGERHGLPQEFLQLPATHQLVIREARWDAQQLEVSLCRLQLMPLVRSTAGYISSFCKDLWVLWTTY